MKKIILTLTVCLSLLLLVTACGTNNESASNDKDISGLWTYQEPNEQDPTLIVNADFQNNETFEIEVTKNVLEDNLQNTTTVITGKYTDDGKTITLNVEKIDDADVKDMEPVEVGYTLSGDSEQLTLTGAEVLNPDIPESIEMTRNNASD